MTICIIDTGFGCFILTSDDEINWKQYRKGRLNYATTNLIVKKLNGKVVKHFNSSCAKVANLLGAKKLPLTAADLPKSLRKKETIIN